MKNQRSFSEVHESPSFTRRLPFIAELLSTEATTEAAVPSWALPFLGTSSLAERISLHDFLVRMCKYGDCSAGAFIVMAVYLARLQKKTGLRLVSSIIHRVVLVAFVTAVKMTDDLFFSNSYYARMAGISAKEMRVLENVFVTWMEWDFVVSDSEFRTYALRLDKLGGRKSGASVSSVTERRRFNLNARLPADVDHAENSCSLIASQNSVVHAPQPPVVARDKDAGEGPASGQGFQEKCGETKSLHVPQPPSRPRSPLDSSGPCPHRHDRVVHDNPMPSR
eukprot:TRINITY_DN23393_c0_g1_i1.p1 TRINITY_DN23393_c0_g1~~TRINITY_DN23393_c0_g1_i1.p1  ORF type:complete len:280 (+),score=54.63 TRINITY_DN23393_c0_g1_i1:46-885(+)